MPHIVPMQQQCFSSSLGQFTHTHTHTKAMGQMEGAKTILGCVASSFSHCSGARRARLRANKTDKLDDNNGLRVCVCVSSRMWLNLDWMAGRELLISTVWLGKSL